MFSRLAIQELSSARSVRPFSLSSALRAASTAARLTPGGSLPFATTVAAEQAGLPAGVAEPAGSRSGTSI